MASLSVIIILLWGWTHHPVTVITVTAGEKTQLFHGLLVVCRFRPLDEETGSHTANVKCTCAMMQLGQPAVECGPWLEGSHDRYWGDHRGSNCRGGGGVFYSIIKYRFKRMKHKRFKLGMFLQPGGGSWHCKKPWASRDWLNIWGKGGVSLLGVDANCTELFQNRQTLLRTNMFHSYSVTWQCGNLQRSWGIERPDVGS